MPSVPFFSIPLRFRAMSAALDPNADSMSSKSTSSNQISGLMEKQWVNFLCKGSDFHTRQCVMKEENMSTFNFISQKTLARVH